MKPSTNHSTRLAGGLGLAVAVLLATATAATAAASPAHQQPVAASQQVAVLNHDTEAFNKPNRSSGSAGEVNEVRPITGERTVLPVVATTTDVHGARWLDVRLPGRPNSHTGWIPESIVTVTVTNWQIVVHLSTRQVVVFDGGHTVRTFLVVVGKPSTPTPTGYFFVEETVPLGPQGSGAPFALALSARSNALAQFDGGPGQVALHGIANIGGTPGTAVSHGCVRLNTADVAWLGAHISSGVPVTITA
jgi:lipoprotein-anchoring transpeptidase ErfK/SrfK